MNAQNIKGCFTWLTAYCLWTACAGTAPAATNGYVVGGLARQVYLAIPGVAVADLTNNIRFPDSPDLRDATAAFESRYLGTNYGQILSGYLLPAVSGDYVFYLASDDGGQLWLSTDDTAANKQLIAEEPLWNLERNWQGQWASWDPTLYKPGRASAAISLQAGRAYYVEALHKQAQGGDYLAVAWKPPGASVPANGSEPIGGSFLAHSDSGAPAGLPVPWQSADIGAVGFSGGASCAAGTFLVKGSGEDIWDNQDSFQFAFQPLEGDAEIVAHVAALEATDPWTKAGLMIRETLAPGSKHATMLLTPGNGASFQWRGDTGGPSAILGGWDGVSAPYWLKLTRVGGVLIGYKSADGKAWSVVGSTAMDLARQAQVGLCVSAHNNGALAAARFDHVQVYSLSPATNIPTLGALRRQTYFEVEGPAVSNFTANAKYPQSPDQDDLVSSLESQQDGVFGERLWGYLYPPLTGEYVFYLTSSHYSQMRLSPDAGPAHSQLMVEVAGGNPGHYWQGDSARHSAAVRLEAGRPYYIEVLHNQGFDSKGVAVAWQVPGGPPPANGSLPIDGAYLAYSARPTIATQPQNQSILAGSSTVFFVRGSAPTPLGYQWRFNGIDLADNARIHGAQSSRLILDDVLISQSGSYSVVVSNADGAITSAGARLNVTLSSPAVCPWPHQDIDTVALAGNASWQAGQFTITAGSAGRNDPIAAHTTTREGHFVFQPLEGDGEIVARVVGLRDADSAARAGVMICETLEAAANFGSMTLGTNGATFHWRGVPFSRPGETTSADTIQLPYWVKLQRQGARLVGSISPDGLVWTEIGSGTAPMVSTVYAGLCATSGRTDSLVTAVFDQVQLRPGNPLAFEIQPADLIRVEGQTAQVTARVGGPLPYSYRWYAAGQPVGPAATNVYSSFVSYSTPPLRLADNGMSIYLAVTNLDGTGYVLSRAATVFVLRDTNAPTLLEAMGQATDFEVVFSEPVEAASAGIPGNYALSDGVSVTAATVSPSNPAIVRLTTSRPVATNVLLTVHGVRDRASAPNVIAADSSIPVLLTGGCIRFARYDLLLGKTNEPTLVDFPASLESPAALEAAYCSAWLEGYLTVPRTADYTFWIAGEAQGQLFLSSDAAPGGQMLIAEQTDAGQAREYNRTPAQQSSPIHLVQGQRYYLSACYQAAAAPGGLAIAMTTSPAIDNGAGPIPGRYLSPLAGLDEPAPVLVDAVALTPTSVLATFSKPMAVGTADSTCWQLSGGLLITNVVQREGNAAQLLIALDPSTPLNPANQYTLREPFTPTRHFAGPVDFAGNPLAPTEPGQPGEPNQPTIVIRPPKQVPEVLFTIRGTGAHLYGWVLAPDTWTDYVIDSVCYPQAPASQQWNNADQATRVAPFVAENEFSCSFSASEAVPTTGLSWPGCGVDLTVEAWALKTNIDQGMRYVTDVKVDGAVRASALPLLGVESEASLLALSDIRLKTGPEEAVNAHLTASTNGAAVYAVQEFNGRQYVRVYGDGFHSGVECWRSLWNGYVLIEGYSGALISIKVNPESPPRLEVTASLTGPFVKVKWPSQGPRVLTATDLTGPWTAVPGSEATNELSYPMQPAEPRRFFKLSP